MQVWLELSMPRLIAPKVGLIAKLPQYPAGLMMDPPVCEPIAAGSMPAPIAAADPLEDPPGVQRTSNGFRVALALPPPSSVVASFPITTAPASRKA
jgi:hypothetical protein